MERIPTAGSPSVPEKIRDVRALKTFVGGRLVFDAAAAGLRQKWSSRRQTGMYGPPLCRKRKTKVTGWSAQMYPAFVKHKLLALDGMRCALVLLSNAALEGIFLFTGFESAGFDRCVIS